MWKLILVKALAFILLNLAIFPPTLLHAVDFVNVGSPFINTEKIDKQNLANVSAIMEDKQGYVWLANDSGVLRFDGNSFKKFPALAQFTSPNTEFILEGQQGRIWIAEADKGLTVFDTNDASMRFYPLSSLVSEENTDEQQTLKVKVVVVKENTLYVAVGGQIIVFDEATFEVKQRINAPIASQDSIIRMLVTHDDHIWVSAYEGNGVMRYDGKQWRKFEHQDNEPSTVSARLILQIFEDSQHRIWLGTYSGLDLFLPEYGQFKRFTPRDLNLEPNKNLGAIGNLVSGIAEDDEGTLWLALYHGGVFKFDPASESFHYYQSVKDVASTHISNAMTLYPSVIFMDKNQTLWSQTQKGISRLTKDNRRLMQWVNTSHDKCLPNAMYESSSSIFFGCKSALYRFDGHNISHVADFERGIFSITQSSSNVLWIGTNGAGVYRYNLATAKFTHYQFESGDKSPLMANMVKQLIIDDVGDLYGLVSITKDNNGSGIIRYNADQDMFEVLDSDFKYSGILNADTHKLLLFRGYTTESSNLYWLNKHSQQLTQLPFNTGRVHAALKWGEEIWIATELLGLIRINIRSGEMNKVLLGDVGTVSGLYLDQHQQALFYSVKNRLYRLKLDEQGKTRSTCITCSLTIDISDLNHQQFGQLYISNSFLAGNDVFYLRTTNRLLAIPIEPVEKFHPDGRLVLTDYQVMGKSVIPNDGSGLLSQAIEQTSKITIPPQTTFFSFSFAKLGLVLPERVEYAYKLEGLNRDWIYTDAERTEAVYSLLPAGHYVFKVKATDENGNWSDEILTLEIDVLSPWWQTWWAYTVYICAVIAILLSLAWLYHRSKIAESERRSILALAETKEQLFANLSHEFRTPLTLVMGPAQAIQAQSHDPQIKAQAGLIERNADRLLFMVDQLLQLSQLKDQNVHHVELQHVASVCHQVMLSFEALAQERDISLILAEPIDSSWWINGPQNALETILINLIGNAFKYTSAGGKISLSVESQPQAVRFHISDTGCGIAQEHQVKIFERFTRLNNSCEYVAGTGIGLALVKELVDTMVGNICVKSELGRGTEFIFSLPKVVQLVHERDVLANGEVDANNNGVFDSLGNKTSDLPSGGMDGTTDLTHSNSIISDSSDTPIILIVDDNAEMRAFLSTNLASEFQVIEAADGVQALTSARAHSPDLIISDVMMPHMDGFDLLNQIRTDMSISHTPVILLTAKGDQQSKMKGLSELADDFITKPFYPQQLKTRVLNLLGIRAIMQKRIMQYSHVENENNRLNNSEPLSSKSANKALTAKDKVFIEQLEEVLELKHGRTDLSLSVLANHFAMSERQLQRKLKALSGSTFSELLREYRLAKAVVLLDEGERVSIIAERVGFNSSSYFVRCFKAKYGKTPKEYRA